MIKSRCPNCEALLGFDDHLAGHKVRCPRCKVTMTVLPPQAQPARPQSPRPEIHVVQNTPQHAAAPGQGGVSAGGAVAVLDNDPLAAIAQAESAVDGPQDHSDGGGHHHHHVRHHHHRRGNNTTTMVLVIAFLMIAAFGMGFFTGSSYRNFALSDAGRLLPPDKTIDDFVPAPPVAGKHAAPQINEPVANAAASITPDAPDTPTAINTPSAPAPQIRSATNPRRYAIVAVGFGGYQDDAGRSRLQFWLSNSTDKAIESIKGRVQVFDENNEHLGDLELLFRDGIPDAGNAVATESWDLTGPIVTNFINDGKKLRYKFETDSVTYKGGASEVFE